MKQIMYQEVRRKFPAAITHNSRRIRWNYWRNMCVCGVWVCVGDDATQRWYIRAHVSIDGLYCRWSFDFHTRETHTLQTEAQDKCLSRSSPLYFVFTLLYFYSSSSFDRFLLSVSFFAAFVSVSAVFSAPFGIHLIGSLPTLAHGLPRPTQSAIVVSPLSWDLFIGKKWTEKYDVHCFLHSFGSLFFFFLHVVISYLFPFASQTTSAHNARAAHTISNCRKIWLFVIRFHDIKELFGIRIVQRTIMLSIRHNNVCAAAWIRANGSWTDTADKNESEKYAKRFRVINDKMHIPARNLLTFFGHLFVSHLFSGAMKMAHCTLQAMTAMGGNGGWHRPAHDTKLAAKVEKITQTIDAGMFYGRRRRRQRRRERNFDFVLLSCIRSWPVLCVDVCDFSMSRICFDIEKNSFDFLFVVSHSLGMRSFI